MVTTLMRILGLPDNDTGFPPARERQYTGWNPRAEGYGAGTLFPLQGAVVPFAATKAEREAKGDPRLSVAERYADNAAYVDAVRKAAARMVAERLMLPQDAERAIEAATQDTLSQLR